jgi:hypothetical protein
MQWWNAKWQGKNLLLEKKACHEATLSTVDFICACMGFNPDLRSTISTTNSLSSGDLLYFV